MSLRLPVDLYSPDHISLHIQELRAYIGEKRNAAAQVKAGGEAESPSLSSTLTALLHSAAVKAEDMRALEGVVKDLEVLRDKAPVVHLTFAAMPNRTLIRQLTVWFRNQVHPYTLLTVAMRRDIGGGMMLRTGSNIYDFSFRGQILRHKERISELFESVR